MGDVGKCYHHRWRMATLHRPQVAGVPSLANGFMHLRLPGRQSLRVHAEADKEVDTGTEAKPTEAGGNFYNDERPVSVPCPSMLCPCLAVLL